MSLALLQGYSSAEEEEEQEQQRRRDLQYDNSSDENENENDGVSSMPSSYHPLPSSLKPSGGSALPSALEAFSEISGPPEFLNNCVEESNLGRASVVGRGRMRSRNKKDLPIGAVVEAKAQLVGIHERVRSDVDGNFLSTSSTQTQKGSSGTATEGSKRVSTASNPDAEDASQLLRMCVQCGIPKTYSSARGMFCPVCGDRPPSEDQGKQKGSTIKDKEKIKRMRGQSSHATWKSETEMQLRQQFD
ncbi:hypothetical protein Ancab_028007 [Ancistrocladus abbreviatus]